MKKHVDDADRGPSAEEERFVSEYLTDFRAADAMRRMRPEITHPKQRATTLMARPRVQALIRERLAPLLKSADVEADRVLREYAIIAFSDVAEFVDDDGHLITNPRALAFDARRAIKKVKVTERVISTNDAGETLVERRTEFELYDKLTALRSLGEYLKLFATAPQVPSHLISADVEEARQKLIGKLIELQPKLIELHPEKPPNGSAE